VAEGARLESVYTGNRIVGSNPTPSANSPFAFVRQCSKSAVKYDAFCSILSPPHSPRFGAVPTNFVSSASGTSLADSRVVTMPITGKPTALKAARSA
jgi:hypothetical protein